MRWNRKYLNLMYFGRKLEVVTSLQFKYYTLLNFRLRNRVFLLWSRWRKWYLIIFPFLLFCKKKRKICTCHFNHMRMSTWKIIAMPAIFLVIFRTTHWNTRWSGAVCRLRFQLESDVSCHQPQSTCICLLETQWKGKQ